MRIIDRYLLLTFFKVFFICFISLTGLYVVIDFSGNLIEFITYGREQGGLLRVVAEYYGPRVLTFFDLAGALITLIAAMFTVTLLQRNNEMTALMAAGISKARIARPVIGAVIGVALLAAVSRELVIPIYRHKLQRNAQDWMGENERPMQAFYDHQTEVLLRGKTTLAAEQRINEPNFRLPPQFASFGRNLVAATAHYQLPQDDRPGGYLLSDVSQPADVDLIESIRIDDRPMLLGPVDTPWLRPGECFLVSGVSFEHLAGSGTWKQCSSTGQLISFLHNPSLDFGADVRVLIHSRLVRPFLDTTLLFLGLPLVLRRETRNMFVAIGQCMAVVAAFFVVVEGSHWLGTSLLSPALAAWTPLMIFAPVAILFSGPLTE